MMYGNLLLILVIGLIIYMMMRKSGGCCGGHDHDSHSGTGGSGDTNHSHHHQIHTGTSEASTETDPVCGMQVTDQRIESRYLGQRFHFCSEQCKNIFNLNPNKFARVS